MKSPLIAAVIFAAITPATGLLAADTGATTATASATASTSPAQPAPVPNKIIYAARLPTPQEIATSAASQGLVVDSIAQTGADITVVYDLGKGQTNTVSYQLLPSAGAPAAPSTVVAAPTATPAPATPAPTVIYTQQPATQVIYTSPAPVYYDSGYYPYYYPPVVVGFGFGWGGGWRGGWHGGWHR